MPRPLRAVIQIGVLFVLLLALAKPAAAHWCDCLWASAYNIVVRPEVDAVDVPASGEATLAIWVQNNMGYPLKNFSLDASASGYSVSEQLDTNTRTVSSPDPYLLPGEKARYLLRIAVDSASAGSMLATQLDFSIGFGNGNAQDQYYPTVGGGAAYMRLPDGTTYPAAAISDPGAGGQAVHLGSGAIADFGDSPSGLDDLLNEYCVGRARWMCSSITDTNCGSRATGGGSNYDYEHLWAAEFLAARKAGLAEDRKNTFRSRLICGYDDDTEAFWSQAIFMLGYLGENATARTFIEERVQNASGTELGVAKAALLLLGNQTDYTSYHADVVAGMSSGDQWVEIYSAAALGIVDSDNAAVASHLVTTARWEQPDAVNSGLAFTAAHLLDLVTWDRRGWATNAADTGCGGYYRGCDSTPPPPPGNVRCDTSTGGGTARIQWDQVTTEPISRYWVYWGNAQRSGGCSRPGTCATDYNSSANTSSIFYDLSGLAMGTTYYVAVTSVDSAGNFSDYSTEVSCAIPVSQVAPVARLTCAPTSGNAPLDVSCDGTASSDANGAADIAHRYFRLDSGAEVDEADALIEYPALAAGNHTVTLRVVDSTDRSDSATVSISVTTPGNEPPTARISATPLSGLAPLTVSFDGSASSDSDGSITSWDWDFADGSGHGSGATASHAFASDGTYNVVLTVTDDGGTPLTGTAVVTITVGGAVNQPPDISTASATPWYGPAPLTVAFDASGVRDPDGDPVSVSWDFGDASAPSTELAISHTYSANGVYTAVLTAQDDQQPANVSSTSFHIAVTDNLPPDLEAAVVTPASGVFPLTVTFDATLCTDPDGDAISYRWEIAVEATESVTSDSPTMQHTFADPGDYDATLTLTDDGDPPLEVTRHFTIDVQYPPESGLPEQVKLLKDGCACASADPAALQLAAGAALIATLGVARRRRRG